MKGQKRLFRQESGVFLCGCMAVCTFFMSCLALHDMQTAEGVGLYIALSLQSKNRLLFDLLVDGLGAAVLLLCAAAPCMGKKGKWRKMFFLLVAYVALMPTVSLASLVHLFSDQENYRICSGMVELLKGLEHIAPVVGFWLPTLCLLLAAGRLQEKSRKMSIRQRIFLIVQPVLAIFTVLFPGFASHLSFVMQYLFLLSAFEAWERLHENAEKYSPWEIVLFGGLWLRGGYVLFELMSRY